MKIVVGVLVVRLARYGRRYLGGWSPFKEYRLAAAPQGLSVA